MESRFGVPVLRAPADRKRQGPQIKKTGGNDQNSVHRQGDTVECAMGRCWVDERVIKINADREEDRHELQKRATVVLKPADFGKMQADFVSRCDFIVESYHDPLPAQRSTSKKRLACGCDLTGKGPTGKGLQCAPNGPSERTMP